MIKGLRFRAGVLCLLTIILFPASLWALVSDNFNLPNLDPGVWAFIDPVGDATLRLEGAGTPSARLLLSVPAGTPHDPWTGGNFAPRVMQAIENTDFAIQVRFDSGVSDKYVTQGIMVEAATGDFVRFDFLGSGNKTRLFAATLTGNTAKTRIDTVIPGGSPLYMRMTRNGNQWDQHYSYDGVNWLAGASFQYSMVVAAAGVFVGNAGSYPPAHTAVVDYFFDLADTAFPEDGTPFEDTLPPLIYGIQDLVSDTAVRLNWKTEEPASGAVHYGLTTDGELGTLPADTVSYSQSVLVPGLEPDTTYNFVILSRDAGGNESRSENLAVRTTANAPPCTVHVWYGPDQDFGHLGIPQRWVNVLGRLEGCENIESLTYSLNGSSPSPLSIGADGYRLAAPGDFNVDLAYADLTAGSNQVIIIATDVFGNDFSETVDVHYHTGNYWPEVYDVDWGALATIQDGAQVVDGLWSLESGGVRSVAPGYDRLLDIGDLGWTDYEVTVPVTIHGIDPAGYLSPSDGPAVGLLLRWSGHFDWGGSQPNRGWYPMGAIGWYRWQKDTLGDRLQLLGNKGRLLAQDESGRKLAFGQTYVFRMRVETTPTGTSLYRLKVWPDGEPEPSTWDLSGGSAVTDPSRGSFLLVAHHVDATFGKVKVTPLGNTQDTTPPALSGIQFAAGSTSASISWTTNEPAAGSVAYGKTEAYELGTASDPQLKTSHALTLEGLAPATTYHFQVRAVDAAGNAAASADLLFTTAAAGEEPPGGPVSDDFNGSTLDSGVWTLVDPRGDATLALTGSQVALSVPAGVSHDAWTGGNFAPRLLQAVADVDFEVEAKFDSAVLKKHQIQGIVVEEDGSRYLRFDFFSDSSSTRLYAASLSGSTASVKVNKVVSGATPQYLRVRRAGSQWTLWYSYDGVSWVEGVAFSHSLRVTAVGLHVGNAGTSPPAHTALIDYIRGFPGAE